MQTDEFKEQRKTIVEKTKPLKIKLSKIKEKDKPSINPKEFYLTEEKLYEFLKEVFPWFEITRDYKLLFQKDLNNPSRKRPDYQIIDIKRNLKYIVEFEGDSHYRDTEVQFRDFQREEAFSLYDSVITIPYFIQLDKEIIENLFWKLEWFVNAFPEGYNKYPHWFVDKDAKMPFDYNEIWLELFKNELNGRFFSKKKEIIESIKKHPKTFKIEKLGIDVDSYLSKF